MEKTYIIKDYMQKKVVTVSPDTTVAEATTIMLTKKTNGAVVVDEQGHVIGILSSWDIIKHIMPEYLHQDQHLAMFEAADVFQKRIEEVKNDPVSAFMTTHVHTAKETDTLMSAIILLAEFHVRQLPIVNDENTLIGYINRTDIKRAVGDVLSA